MSHDTNSVAVMQIPGVFDADREHLFISELGGRLNACRPRIVLDCSNLQQMDKPTLHLLLCCLEEVMKRNGDVKLARIPKGGLAGFGLSGAEGLFEVFDTISGAVDSFQRFSMESTPGLEDPNSASGAFSVGTLPD